MSGVDAIAVDAAVRLDGAAVRPPLRFLTCGSVDDGKSTLLGRLLYEQSLILEDHLTALERDFRTIRHQRTGGRFFPAARRPRGRARTAHHH